LKKAALLFFICFQVSQLIAQQNYSAETLKKIKEVENNVNGNLLLNDEVPGTIAGRMAKYKVKGLSMAVIHDYKIAWAKGYGWADEEAKKPVTTKTLFEPGSISKVLNAVGILKLAQDKKVDLYTDINTYLTSWKFPYDSISKGKKITLAQILTHNAGLSTYGFPGRTVNGATPTLLQVLDGKPPAVTDPVRSMFEPGLRYEYSGGGITISQLLLTDVTRQVYDTWMYKNVLKPLGMLNSSYAQPPAKDKQYLCASGYYADGSPVPDKFRVYPWQAAAGLWTAPGELCNYIIDMQLAHRGKPSKVLSPEMVKLHLTPYNNGPAAMGTFFDDRGGAKYFLHDASNEGFCGLFVASLDSGDGVVIFLNSGDGKLLLEVLNSVAGAYHWKNYYREPQRKKTVEVPDSVLKTYEGIYLYDQAWAAVGKKDTEYHYYSNNVYAKMYYSTTTSFFNEEFPSVKEFIKDEKGNITGYTRTVNGKEYPKAIKITRVDTLRLEGSMWADIGWYLFENKKYKESLVYYTRGVQLYPENLNLLMNLAHVYLFNRDYENAIAIYKAHLTDTISPGNSWEHQLRTDLVYFKEHKYDVQLFDKVFEALKIKKPEGY
jgi:CubicO group peptidase (beta-lactamase class C family)